MYAIPKLRRWHGLTVGSWTMPYIFQRSQGKLSAKSKFFQSLGM